MSEDYHKDSPHPGRPVPELSSRTPSPRRQRAILAIVLQHPPVRQQPRMEAFYKWRLFYHRVDPTIFINTTEDYCYLRQLNAQSSRMEFHDERSSQPVVHASDAITIISTSPRLSNNPDDEISTIEELF